MPAVTSRAATHRRERIQRSSRCSRASNVPGDSEGVPGELSTRRVAFHSLLQKRLYPSTRLSSKRTSWLDIATDEAHARRASAPYFDIRSRGSTPVPSDLDMRRPSAACTTQWMTTSENGTSPMNSRPVMIIRLTQRLMISLAVQLMFVGKKARRSSVSSGQPSVAKGHSADENHVSSTSGSCVSSPFPHSSHLSGGSTDTVVCPLAQ